MKNTELIKVEGILKYEGELNKVKLLEQDKYTVKEAAEYFGCASSQVKGYITNYKDVLGDNVYKEIPKDKKKEVIMINKTGMFLLALLLGKRSRISEKLFNVVHDLVEKETSKCEQITMKEIASTKESKKVVSLEELKEKKAKQEEEMIEVPELEMTEDGPKFVIKKITKKEYEDRQTEAKEKISQIFDEIFSELEEDEDEFDEEESCTCAECLEEELNLAIHESNMMKLRARTTLDMQLRITKSYKEICEVLGMDELESSILIQDYITNGDEDIDRAILNHLVNEKLLIEEKQVGSLNYSMNLLAIEKFDESEEDAYLHLANEMKYVIGKDLTDLVVKRNYKEVLTTIVRLKAFEEAQAVIFTLISE